MRIAASMAAAVVLALFGAGCGSDRLSSSQLRSRAQAICERAQASLTAVTTPSTPSQALAFLDGGLRALRPRADALAKLKPPTSLDASYREALALGRRVIARLSAAAASLREGDDAAATIAGLDRELHPLLSSEQLRWTELGVRACVSR